MSPSLRDLDLLMCEQAVLLAQQTVFMSAVQYCVNYIFPTNEYADKCYIKYVLTLLLQRMH